MLISSRKKDGDTDRALAVMEKALDKKENEIPDYLGLCGRIYKDKYLNSDCKDTDSLKKAIEWYRKGFDALQSVYNGINLATLLTADGHRFAFALIRWLLRSAVAENIINKKHM